ncbi:MAG: tetratricopeptide repeat protein [Gammaproteobacteria bacterium]|nr:tetratricopeptide repeat protein [Gammaproteobacteria bacterium]
MINTKIHKAVYTLSEKLLRADNQGKQEQFDALFAELKQICTDNENSEKDHPEQWETLADFTADFDEALVIYDKALQKAIVLNTKDYISSISFSMAQLQSELGNKGDAIEHLQRAKISANKIIDKELKAEIDELLEQLLND